jgi:pimeloyl-ACP methyl ester carboxylesterase
VRQITLSANGLHFDGLSAGPADGPLVLLLHGFPQFADAWTTTLAALGAQGFHAVAVDQRGYSPRARPAAIEDYVMDKLSADALGFADSLGARHFHLVGHDWGGAVAWAVAARQPERLLTLSVLSTPHPAALASALRSDSDQQARSAYFRVLTAPDGGGEKYLLADGAKALRGAYLDKVPQTAVDSNVRRLQEGGTLTAALNWYRAMILDRPPAAVSVPTLYIWGERDQALGRTAAFGTVNFCTGPYRFEVLPGKSHWLLEECPEEVLTLLRQHLGAAHTLDA